MGEPLPRSDTPGENPPPVPEPGATALAEGTVERPAERPADLPVVPPAETARLAFHRDLLAAHREFGPLEKKHPVYEDKPADVERKLARGEQPPIRYYYADLNDVLNLTDPVLQEHGFYHRTDVAQTEEGGLRYILTLTHEQGHSIEGVYELSREDLGLGKAGEKTSPIQRRGSIDTYARRYLLCHVLGLAAEPDTDGQDLETMANVPAVDQTVAGIFGAPRTEPAAADGFTGQVKSEPAPAPVRSAAPAETSAPAEASPAVAAPTETASSAEDDLRAAKNKLTGLFIEALKGAGLADNKENILAMLDLACADVGVSPDDLDLNAVQAMITMQGIMPADPAKLELVPG